MSTIGARIKARRKELGMTADDLAEIIGKNRATVYRYENGYIEEMPIAVIEPMAAALRTTPAYLMGWEESGGKTDKYRTEILSLIEKMSPEKQEEAVRILKAILGK